MNLSENYYHNLTLLKQLDDEMALKLAPVTIYLAVVMVTGIVGNSLVCYVHGMKMKKSTANFFILWLAVLDLLTCLIGLPMETCDLVFHYTFGVAVVCKIFRFTVYFTIVTAVMTLLFIAVDRYCKICRPFKDSPIRECRVVVAVSLLMGGLISWPALIVFGKKRITTTYPGVYGVDCSLDDAFVGSVIPTIYLGTLAVCFIISATVLIVLYTLIGCELYKRSTAKIGDPGNSTFTERRSTEPSLNAQDADSVDRSPKVNVISQNRTNRHYRLGRTGLIFLTITLVFVLSFVPSLTLMIVRTVKSDFASSLSDTGYVLYCFGLRTYFINNSVNFIIYGCINPMFRRECVQIWQRVKSSILKKCDRGENKETKGHNSSHSSRTEQVTEESL